MTEEFWEFNPRAWYIARPGHVLLVADLVQAEVRMLAVKSQCPVLTQSILQGGDLHEANAKAIWPDKWRAGDSSIRKGLRTRAKTCTFGTIYGVGPKTLGEQLGVSQEEAQEILEDFYDTFTGVTKWKHHEEISILKSGYSETWLGRRRTPVLIQKPPRATANPREDPDKFRQQNLQIRLWNACWDEAIRKGRLDPQTATRHDYESRAVRQCINHSIQGSVGELINWAAWNLIRLGVRVVLQMHDELVVEVRDTPEEIATRTATIKSLLNQEIEGVPFVANVTAGKSWAAAKEVK